MWEEGERRMPPRRACACPSRSLGPSGGECISSGPSAAFVDSFDRAFWVPPRS